MALKEQLSPREEPTYVMYTVPHDYIEHGFLEFTFSSNTSNFPTDFEESMLDCILQGKQALPVVCRPLNSELLRYSGLFLALIEPRLY